MMDYPEDADLYGDAEPAVFPPVADLVVTWDEEAHGWMGTSPSVPGLITSATTQDELREKAAMYAWHLRKPLTPAEQATVDRAYADYAGRIRAEEDARGDRMAAIATYHANRAAKAQRVAEEGGDYEAAVAQDTMRVASARMEFIRSKGLMAEYTAWLAGKWVVPDDDLPTLPPTALRGHG